jgi:hypothetical protein
MTDVALFHIDADNIVRFSLKNMKRTIEGPEEALQLVAFAMFTSPGSCQFARQDGGGMKELKGANIPPRQQLLADVAVILKRAMDTVRRAQRAGRAANATVTALELIDAYGDPGSAKIVVKVRIRLQSGNTFQASFEGQ